MIKPIIKTYKKDTKIYLISQKTLYISKPQNRSFETAYLLLIFTFPCFPELILFQLIDTTNEVFFVSQGANTSIHSGSK
jgi:hypothetical protein